MFQSKISLMLPPHKRNTPLSQSNAKFKYAFYFTPFLSSHLELRCIMLSRPGTEYLVKAICVHTLFINNFLRCKVVMAWWATQDHPYLQYPYQLTLHVHLRSSFEWATILSKMWSSYGGVFFVLRVPSLLWAWVGFFILFQEFLFYQLNSRRCFHYSVPRYSLLPSAHTNYCGRIRYLNNLEQMFNSSGLLMFLVMGSKNSFHINTRPLLLHAFRWKPDILIKIFLIFRFGTLPSPFPIFFISYPNHYCSLWRYSVAAMTRPSYTIGLTACN